MSQLISAPSFFKNTFQPRLFLNNDYGNMTIVMKNLLISKSKFKPKALEYFRMVEEEKKVLVITHSGNPVAKIIPYESDDKNILDDLAGSLLSYEDPKKSVGIELWEGLK